MMDVSHRSSPKTAPLMNHAEDFVLKGKISIKLENNDTEENGITDNKTPRFDFTEPDADMRVKGTSDNTSDFSANRESKENASFESFADGIVITERTVQKGNDTTARSLFASPLEQRSLSFELLPRPEKGAVVNPLTPSISSKDPMKLTFQDCVEATTHVNELSAERCKLQFTSTTAVQECASSQSDWIPFEFVNSATIKKEVTTDSNDCVDETTSTASLMQISPSTSPINECSAPPSEKKFSCKQCPAQFNKKYSLQKHLLCHPGERVFSCRQCSAQFISKSGLEKHTLTHSNVRAFSCERCSAQFKQKPHLERHMLTHSAVRAFSCDQCSAQFTRKDRLKYHLLTHSNVRAFSCEQCSAPFNSKSDLVRHMLIHSNVRAFSCELCSAQFKHKSHLDRHMITHSNMRALSCERCSAQFKHKSYLERHMLTHSNLRAFSCEQCSAQFNLKSGLERHMLIHSNVRAFSCGQCSAQFRCKPYLKEHMLIHSNVRAFACGHCSAQFKRKRNLRQHMSNHLNEISFS